MKYQEIFPITRSEAEAAMSGGNTPTDTIIEILLRLSLNSDEVTWKQNLFEAHLQSEELDIQRAALQSLGHLARVGSGFNKKRALEATRKFKDHKILSGIASDVEDDIQVFAK